MCNQLNYFDYFDNIKLGSYHKDMHFPNSIDSKWKK